MPPIFKDCQGFSSSDNIREEGGDVWSKKRDGQSEEVKVKSTEHDHHLLPFI